MAIIGPLWTRSRYVANLLQHIIKFSGQLISSFLFNSAVRIESSSWTESDPVVVIFDLYWAGWKPLTPLHETVKALSSSFMHLSAGVWLRAIYRYSSTIRLCNGTGSLGHTRTTYLEGFTTYCTIMFASKNWLISKLLDISAVFDTIDDCHTPVWHENQGQSVGVVQLIIGHIAVC